MIVYLPIEPLFERYTAQMDIWVRKTFDNMNVDYITIYGERLTDVIETGSVLDAEGTNYYKFSQLMKICNMIKKGVISDGDIIFFGDSWFPGQEAIPYMASLENIKLRIFGINWAGSSDKYDFVNKMGNWVKWIERGWYEFYDTVFVGSRSLRDSMIREGITNKVKVTGCPFDSKQVESVLNKRFGIGYEPPKEDNVVFPHRWDTEKNPMFFLRLIEEIPDAKFIVTTSRKKFVSNDEKLIQAYYRIKDKVGDKLTLLVGLSKAEYYDILARSKVFFSSAYQETFGYAMMEALTFQCIPVAPNRLSYVDYIPNRYRYNTFSEAVDFVKKGLKTNDTIERREIKRIAEKQNSNIQKLSLIHI